MEHHDDKYDVYVKGTSNKIEDAVVIRLQDAFASSALYAYSHNIVAAISVLVAVSDGMGTGESRRMVLAIAARLQQSADYFANAAEVSADMRTKLPD